MSSYTSYSLVNFLKIYSAPLLRCHKILCPWDISPKGYKHSKSMKIVPNWEGMCMLSCVSCIWLLATLWTVAHQALLSKEFSRQEFWNVLPFLSLNWEGKGEKVHFSVNSKIFFCKPQTHTLDQYTQPCVVFKKHVQVPTLDALYNKI